MSEFFYRLGMAAEMREAINNWCVDNRDPDSGKVPSFAEGCRQLIQSGLDKRTTAKSRKGE